MGLLPFLFLPLAIEVNRLALYEGSHYFSQYSALILSFLGGTLWQQSINAQGPKQKAYLAMFPSIIGWFSLAFLPVIWCIVVLMSGFLLLLIYEISATKMPFWYRQLRITLTSIVMGCHLVLTWQVHQLG